MVKRNFQKNFRVDLKTADLAKKNKFDTKSNA